LNLNFCHKRVTVESTTDSNSKKYFVIPYLHNISETTASVIKKSNFIVGFKRINKLNSFNIKVQKDKTNFMSKNNAVYKILCDNCDASYVGQTKRQVQTRIKEHINNIRLEPSRYSVITEHILESKHSFDWKNIKILNYEPNYNKRYLKCCILKNKDIVLIRKRILSVLMILTFVYLRFLTAYADISRYYFCLLHSTLFMTLINHSALVQQDKRLRTIGHSFRFIIYF